jgi:hypothetical protein
MKHSGWFVGGRPFSKQEFENSHLKKNTNLNYVSYLHEVARQSRYKTPGKAGYVKIPKSGKVKMGVTKSTRKAVSGKDHTHWLFS